jgi:hypothetical protein
VAFFCQNAGKAIVDQPGQWAAPVPALHSIATASFDDFQCRRSEGCVAICLTLAVALRSKQYRCRISFADVIFHPPLAVLTNPLVGSPQAGFLCTARIASCDPFATAEWQAMPSSRFAYA